jgi:hypothetical protein
MEKYTEFSALLKFTEIVYDEKFIRGLPESPNSGG